MAGATFHLVFRGELLEGAQRSEVEARLVALLGIAPARAAALFSGKAIVLKRDVAKAEAAKYQGAFRRAGARLRAVPVGAQEAQDTPARPRAPAVAPAPISTDHAVPGLERPVARSAPDAELTLAPARGELLSEDERPEVRAVEVDVSHLSAAPPESGSFADLIEERPPPALPDVSGLSLAEAGADLGPERETEVAAVPVPDVDLAEAGALIETLPAPAPVPAPQIDFTVAEPGADLGGEEKPPPPAPDVSHLELAPLAAGRARFVLPD